jgi:hypothetical protein
LQPKPRPIRRRRSSLYGAYRLLLTVAVFMAAVGLVFPLVFKPSVEPPDNLTTGNPLSIHVLVANQNMTPITDVEYTCEVSKLTQPDGTAIAGANTLVRSTILKIPGREALREPCETTYVAGGPIQAAEYKVTISYRMYPWPTNRTAVYYVVAHVAGSGRVTGWTVK